MAENKEVPKIIYTVRFYDAGDPVVFFHGKNPVSSVFGMKDHVKPAEQVSETFTLDHQPPIGELLTKNDRHYQVSEPQFGHIKEGWGKDSVFVMPITKERFRELTRDSVVDQKVNP